jgi:hypothetical protein
MPPPLRGTHPLAALTAGRGAGQRGGASQRTRPGARVPQRSTATGAAQPEQLGTRVDALTWETTPYKGVCLDAAAHDTTVRNAAAEVLRAAT